MATITESGHNTYYQAASGGSTLTQTVWHMNDNKKHAFIIYGDRDPQTKCGDAQSSPTVPDALTPQSAEQVTSVISNFSSHFSDDPRDPFFFRTQVVDDLSAVPGGDGQPERVELDLDAHVLSILLDQSGSMSWNDDKGLRHTVARRLVNRLASTYPGDISFNLVSFGGEPVDVTLFGVLDSTEITGNDVQKVNAAFFQDDESNFAGVRVLRKRGSFPTSPIDGEIVTEGFFSKAFNDDLNEGEEYFFKVFTFDSNFHFSDGVEISATPRERLIPRGVARFSGDVLVGTGVERDDNVIGAWHMDEGAKNRFYDFSDSKAHLLLSDDNPIWLGSADVPMGIAGLRFNGVDTTASTELSSDSLRLDEDDKLTIMAWIFPYTLTGDRVILSRSTASDINYQFYQSGASLALNVAGTTVTSLTALASNEWQHVAVTLDFATNIVEFFVDGAMVESTTIGAFALVDGKKFIDVGFDRTGGINYFFGKMTEVTVHNTVRSNAYIQSHAMVQDMSKDSEPKPDNGDRVVLLEYSIPGDANYQRVLLVKNEFNAPYWEGDGTTILDSPIVTGDAFITDNQQFVLGKSVHYRIFSKNNTGNVSEIADSPNIEIDIPELAQGLFARLDPLSPTLFAPSGPSIQLGDTKASLKWNAISDDRVARVEVYYSDGGFPVIENGKSVSGELVFSGERTETKFVHREAPNNQVTFYTLVTRDHLGRISSPVNVQGIPEDGLDEIGIPLLNVLNLRYELADNSAIALIWDNPIDFKQDLNGFFDEDVFFYAAVTDQFGQPISEDTQIDLEIEASFVGQQIDEDVFTDVSVADLSQLSDGDMFTFSSRLVAPGVLRGTLRMTNSLDRLTAISRADFAVKVVSNIPDPETLQPDGSFAANVFEFESAPISVTLTNPFDVQLINRDGKQVSVECPVECEGLSFIAALNEEGFCTEEKSFDGSHIRAEDPFVARLLLEFKDAPAPAGTPVKVSVWDATVSLCADDPGEKIRPSKTVLPPATTLFSEVRTEDLVDDQGEPTGESREVGFVDIPLTVPRFSQASLLFVQVSFGGFLVTKTMYLFFKDILAIDTTVRAPFADGVDVAEQFAEVYLINPDFPEDESRRTRPPDGTVIRWELIDKEFAKDRPFYSTDASVPTSGIFSRLNNGVARNIFFGPAANIELHPLVKDGGIQFIGERYEVRASVTFDGMHTDIQKPLELFPLSAQNRFGFRFLMEMPKNKNLVWADGEDFVKMRIVKNATTALTRNSSCFRSCAIAFGQDIASLSTGQGIILNAGISQSLSEQLAGQEQEKLEDTAVEILHGEVIEVIDPYTGGQDISLGTDGKSAFGSTVVEMEDDDTFVYFRVNGFFPPPKNPCGKESPIGDDALVNPCECIGATDKPLSSVLCTEITVSGTTTVFLDGAGKLARGGGSVQNGVPPTILVPREPLEIQFEGIKANGQPSNELVIDGETINEIFVSVSFAGKTVPDGIPIAIDIESNLTGGQSKVELRATTIFTVSKLDEDLDDTNIKSYASVKLEPLNPEDEVLETIRFVTTYDKSGTVTRERSTCVSIDFSPGNFDVQEVSNIFSGAMHGYNTVTNRWTTSFASMNHPRGHMHMEEIDNRIYAAGGIDSNTISKFNERYKVDDNQWTDMASMPTSRFGGMSVVVDSKMYVIGGLTADPVTREMIVSDAMERYDPVLDDWEILSSMPIVADGTVDGFLNGVCFGIAEHIVDGVDDKIYVLCGLTKVTNDGRAEAFNERVLIYDVATDHWLSTSAFTGVDLEVYRRISPSSFINSNKIVVAGGATLDETDEASQDDPLIYPVDTFSYDTASDNLIINDSDFADIPAQRYKAATVTILDDNFILGGSNARSQHLNLFERLDDSVSPFVLSELTDMPKARTGLSAAVGYTGEYADPTIFVAGGFQSGRQAGFLQIINSFSPSNVRLDGKSTSAISIELKDESGDHPDRDVNVSVRGFVKFLRGGSGGGQDAVDKVFAQQSDEDQRQSAESVEDKLAIYPVLFTRTSVTTVNGKAVVTLLPRAEDILQNISSFEKDIASSAELQEQLDDEISADVLLSIVAGKIREPYQILVQLTVNDEFFYGQTVNDVTVFDADAGGVDVSQSQSSKSNVRSSGSSEICENTEALDTSLVWSSFSRGISFANIDALSNSAGGFGTGGSTVFSVIPQALGQQTSPIIGYFSDIDWIPAIEQHLVSNDSSADDMFDELRSLENSVPFGASPLFDGLLSVTNVISDNDIDNKLKSIYALTDNESNLSITTLEEAIEAINLVDGNGKVPVVVGNFSVVEPITLSARSNRSDTNSIDKLAKDTGGQAITVLSENFENEIVDIFSGTAVGSLGYGLFEFVVDLGEIGFINRITALFELFTNTNGTWQIAFSKDGITYVTVREIYNANEEVVFDNLEARFVRFAVVLVTGFTAFSDPVYEVLPLAASPALTSIEIDYESPLETFLFLNTEITNAIPQQLSIAVNNSEPEIDSADIQVGVATADSHHWLDFQSQSQPHRHQNGKIFIPLKFSDNPDFADEPLVKVDKFAYRAKFGRWNLEADVTVLDEDGKTVAADDYKLYPRDGLVVFGDKKQGSFRIQIRNQNKFRVGLRLINRLASNPMQICGLGFFYNTNVSLLPPLEKVPPSVQNVLVVPSDPDVYTKFEATYEFIDLNGDQEDTDATQIRWYINGNRIPFLDDLAVWNDIDDFTDPLWRHALTISPNDITVATSAETLARRAGESLVNPGDEIYFTVRPSDGSLFGEITKSSVVEVSQGSPQAEGIQFISFREDGTKTKRIAANNTLTVTFELLADAESNQSVITWFVNGVEFKRGIFGETTEVDGGKLAADRLLPGEVNADGLLALSIGNEIFVTIQPETDAASGEPSTSDTVLVQNALPTVENILLGPSKPKRAQNLLLTYEFVDADIDNGDTQQSDETIIRWFRQSTGEASAKEVTELQGELAVPSSFTSLGDRWFARLTPFDSLDTNDIIDSNTVTIS